MKVLITGSDGFLGRHAARRFTRDGHDVTGVDIKSGHDCREVYAGTTRYDIVLHFAAIVGGRDTIDNHPLSVAQTLALDAALFDYAVRVKPAHVLYPSSSAAYPVSLQHFDRHRRLRESDINLHLPALPDAMYGWVKLTGEQMAARARQCGANIHVIRPMSGYGTDQDTSYPFGAFLDRARRKVDPFPIWGTGLQVRDWVHVDDIMDTIVAVIDQDVSHPVNVGTGIPTDFLTLARLVTQAHGYYPQLDPQPTRPTGVAWRVADITNQVHAPRIGLVDGIKRTR